jgi:ubiquitin-conjugating enzyme E2 variant
MVEQVVPRAEHSKPHQLLEAFGIVTAWFFVVMLGWRCVVEVINAYEYYSVAEGNLRVALMVTAVLAGYIVADLVSGLVHWFFDRFCTTKTFLLGANFVTTFREHHSDPIDITRHGFLSTNGNNCLATVIPLWLIFIAPWSYDNRFWHWSVAMLTVGAVATFATNQFHKWAHTENRPGYIVWLQEHHFILPRDHHKIHHRWPYETHYCITTGWLNRPLVAIGFWRRMERIIGALGFPAHRDAAPVYPEDGPEALDTSKRELAAAE